mmetsp:Transcript_30889/g.80538  ORF Transcript_30889/g.80538 Transcript_30889/m.80538 type:complete len:1017 (-) Transcript_30889:1826-4876(-)
MPCSQGVLDCFLKMVQSKALNDREQLPSKPFNNCHAVVALAVSLHALMAWASPFSYVDYVILILMGISSGIAYVLGRKATHTGSKQAIITYAQESVLHDKELQRLLQGITEFKATIRAFSGDAHSPAGLMLQVLDTYLDGEEPKEEDLHLLSGLFHQFSMFSEATQPLDLAGDFDMEADVQEALLSLLGQCALRNSQMQAHPQSLLHEITPGLLPFDHSTVGTNLSLGTSYRKSGQNDTVGETDEDLPALPTMLANLASAGASGYWQACRYSAEGSLWLQPSLQSALHVLQGSRLPSKNMSASNLGKPMGHNQPSSGSPPAGSFMHHASNVQMACGAMPPLASARFSGSRPALNLRLSSSCARSENAASKSMGTSPRAVNKDFSRNSLDLLGEAVIRAKTHVSCSIPNMQTLQSVAQDEMSGKIPSGHAVINCLSQTNSSHLECSPEHSGGWAQSSPACVGLHGAEVRGEAQYVLEKEACSKEGSAVNKQESTFKPAGGAPGPNPSPFSLGQVWESRGSKEQEGLGIEEHEPQDMDGAGNTEQWDRKKNWSQEHRSVRFQEEAGRIAQPEAPLMLEIEADLEHAYSSFSFDAFHLNEVTQGHPLSTLSYFLFHKSGLISSFKLHALKLGQFLQTIEAGYSPLNPYHNAVHATDVLQTLHVCLYHGWENLEQVDPMLHLAGYLAAVVHDFEHGGYTNDFLKNTHSRLAIRYNDTAPLENHHVAAAFDVLFTSGHNFLCNLPIYDYTRLRKAVIDLVLATDMKQHFHFVSLGKGMVQQPRTWKGPGPLSPQDVLSMRSSCNRSPAPQSSSSQVLRASASMRGSTSMSGCRAAPQKSMEAETIRKKGSVPIDAVKWSERTSCDDSSPSSPQKGLAARISAPPDLSHKESCLVRIAADPEMRLLLLQIALKCADLGHIAEDLDVHVRWVKLLEEEFWRQGDQEKATNLPLSPLFDRTKPGISKSQVGFFDVVVLPLFKVLVSAMPGAAPLLTGAEDNYDYWKQKEQLKQAQQQVQGEGNA